MTNRRFLIIASQALLPIAAGVAFTIGASTYDAPEGGFVAHSQSALDAAAHRSNINTPHFTAQDRKDYPNCDSHTNDLRSKLVVHLDNTRSIMTFDQVNHIAHMPKDIRPDTWVIGSCS